MILNPCCRAWKTAQSMGSKAASLYTPKDGLKLNGLPTLTPSVWALMSVAPIMTKVFITSVVRPLVG
jgi:hypothetical protein